MPENIWSNIVWRGRKIKTFINYKAFKFDTRPIPVDQVGYKQIFLAWFEGYYRYSRTTGNKYFVVYLFLLYTKMQQIISWVTIKSKKVLYLFLPKKVVLGRNACLGIDVFNLKYCNQYDVKLVNQQKTRVDVLLDLINGAQRPETNYLKKFIPRRDLYPLIVQQEKLPWLSGNKDIEYLLMDSLLN